MSIRSDWPKHAAAPGTHEKVLSIVLNQFTKTTKETITACNVPCGAGAFSKRLAESGINVTAVDIAAADNFVFDPTKRILHDGNKGLEIVDITSNRPSGKTLLIEFFRKKLQANLPGYLQISSLYYGEVAIYIMREK